MDYRLQRDFKAERNFYYRVLLDNVYVESEYASKTVKCKECNENFYYISSKEELIKLVETIDKDGDFAFEMLKLMNNFYYPGKDSISFLEDKGICSCCYVNRPKNSLTHRIKSIVNCIRYTFERV